MANAGLDEIAGRLLIQCRPRQALLAAEIARTRDAGLVLTGGGLEATVRTLRESGFTGPLLCDADRYSGSKRVAAARGTHPAWLVRQADLGLLPLTDSGYVALYDIRGLRTILRTAARRRSPVVAVLPLAARWFATTSACEALVREINAHGVPVAIAVEHRDDPFGVQYLIRRFLRLLAAAEVPVILLRSDIAAIGVLCHGAHAAAAGTISALRHTYPQVRRGGAPRPGVSAFVTPLLAYHRLETLERVFDGTPDLAQLWPCECPVCDTRTPARLGSAGEAARHSVHALLALHADLRRARTRAAMISSWHEHCSHALGVHEQVAEEVRGWRAPSGVRGWVKVIDDPVPVRAGIPVQEPRVTAPARAPSR
ncbi:hypothetical protein ABZ342_08640 [Amycolatopsis sp. NPDC005961]|uniref:hypothetical protein n=1 Tax=Amycolatopsis sp. NPDC005961 TaxID=3156720 RepID=UPI0033F76B54